MPPPMRIADRFIAEDDNGQRYHITALQKMIDAGTLEGKGAAPGIVSYFISDGRKLELLEDGVLKIVGTDTRIRRIG